MEKAGINSNQVRWARERAGLQLSDLSKALQLAEDKIAAWETGEEQPTFRQAQKLAERLRVPLPYLFLASPPQENSPIADLRTLRNEARATFSLDFKEVLNDSLQKQNWYREYLQNTGQASPLEFIGKYSVESDVKTVARDIQAVLGLDEELRKSARNKPDFLSKLVQQAEAAGILVLISGVVKNNNHRKLAVEEFRGFVLSDSVAPLVFINGNDTEAAKLFTFVHELAHLWVGASGVSNVEVKSAVENDFDQLERFCNQVAAEVLIPAEDFQSIWQSDLSLEENLQQYRHYKVSDLVLLIRARQLRRISSTEFQQAYATRISWYKNRKRSSGGNFKNTLPARNSKLLTSALITATLEGQTLYRDAARMLNVKVETLKKVADHLEIH
ncbi:MAG: ImmA/IrrE family metallo-endopeptidase [Bacteroidetes bacterium]|jgi:Zn-dependent peptidase ImmA (M78 family)/DNA-binding XRE family transcriptional regulator|nr:ImmA/IrrE family metallo-endopeptidase [Bacteroidota bacterium]